MGLIDLLKAAASNPDFRQFAGRMMASGARDCGAPGCPGKSLPGMVCCICSNPMCNTHATARILDPSKPMCSTCIQELWEVDAPAEAAAQSLHKKPQPKKRKRK